MFIVNNEFLKQQDACGGGITWFNENFSGDAEFLDVVKELITQEEYGHRNWLVQELLDRHGVEDSGNEHKVELLNKKIYSYVKMFGTPADLVEVKDFDTCGFVVDRALKYMNNGLHFLVVKVIYEVLEDE